MSNCSEPPRLVAVGIAPLGIISIGVVPMGVVSIGVVPMGVLSLGVVGMGVVAAGLQVMGLWTFNPGGARHQHHGGAPEQRLMAYPSKAMAEEKARELGCSGVHAMGSLWMPCATHPEAHRR